jgi:hypothetical protein
VEKSLNRLDMSATQVRPQPKRLDESSDWFGDSSICSLCNRHRVCSPRAGNSGGTYYVCASCDEELLGNHGP